MPHKLTRKVYFMSNGQTIISIPPVIRNLLDIKSGDSVQFHIDLSKGKVWIERK